MKEEGVKRTRKEKAEEQKGEEGSRKNMDMGGRRKDE